MFTINHATTGPLEIRFKHNRKNRKAIKNDVTTYVRYPQSTVCFIKSGETVVGTGIARPICEIPVVMDGKQTAQQYGRRLKKVYKLDNGTSIAILKGDNFKYSAGRKTSLEKAMESAGITDKAVRKAIWKAYFDHCKPTAQVNVNVIESVVAAQAASAASN